MFTPISISQGQPIKRLIQNDDLTTSSLAILSPILAKLVFDATRKYARCVINQAQQGKGQRVTGAIMGCGQQGQSESKVERGEIDGYEIMEGYETLEVTERLLIFPNPTCLSFHLLLSSTVC